MLPTFDVREGDVFARLREMPDESVHCVVTSPPYWGLRDYGQEGQLGLEETPDEYVGEMVEVFREVRRVLRGDGTLWLNLGDSYARAPEKGGSGPNGKHDCIPAYGEARKHMAESARQGSSDGIVGRAYRPGTRAIGDGLKPKDLVGIPWRVALALQADGWWLRRDIIWHKPNPMPESVTDRPSGAHEYVFLLAKAERYFYDMEPIREPLAAGSRERAMRNRFGGKYAGADPEEISRAAMGANYGPDGDPEKLAPSAGANCRSVWTITTKPYPGAHFAVFPPELPEKCILAGTSEKGCCPECGSPWERVVEKTATGRVRRRSSGGLGTAVRRETHGAGPVEGTFQEGVVRETVGWSPTCDHGAEPVPCVVLDPFSGAGTTGMVALRHGRSYVGIELNPEYAEQSRQRIRDDAAAGNRPNPRLLLAQLLHGDA